MIVVRPKGEVKITEQIGGGYGFAPIYEECKVRAAGAFHFTKYNSVEEFLEYHDHFGRIVFSVIGDYVSIPIEECEIELI